MYRLSINAELKKNRRKHVTAKNQYTFFNISIAMHILRGAGRYGSLSFQDT
jgi:hypothetical protein